MLNLAAAGCVSVWAWAPTWATTDAGPEVPAAVAVIAWAVVGALVWLALAAWRGFCPPLAGWRLRWDGQGWRADPVRPGLPPGSDLRCAEAAAPGAGLVVRIRLDFSAWMLLQMQVPGPLGRSRSRWAAAARWRIAPSDWRALRVALQAESAPSDPDPAGGASPWRAP